MKNMTVSKELLRDVYCITDRMDMNMTLLAGRERALLVDTGYGFDDLRDAVRRLTGLPLTVVNTHGHHDHACGNYQFDEVYIAGADIPVCEHYVADRRPRIWEQAEMKDIALIADLPYQARGGVFRGKFPPPLDIREYCGGAGIIPCVGAQTCP